MRAFFQRLLMQLPKTHLAGPPTSHQSTAQTGQLNWRVSDHHTSWQVTTFISDALDVTLMSELVDKGLLERFHVGSTALQTTKQLMVWFRPQPMDVEERVDARRTLVKYLAHKRLPIIWKEAGFGYEINKSGGIQRTWKLNRVM